MKINKSIISLNGLVFHSKIGLFDIEKVNGNAFIINISVEVDKIKFNDTIEGTIDYSDLFSIINNIMSKKFNLIETAAHKISKDIHSKFKNIKFCRIEIIKKNPPLNAQLDSSSFILESIN